MQLLEPVSESDRRGAVVSDFLKNRRARLRPEEVGLPPRRRRRIAGLRREEVAALAGLGDTWYGLFESGRNIRVSERVVDNVSMALRLSADEKAYLHNLVAGPTPRTIDFGADRVTPIVAQTIEAIKAAPAFIIGPRLDYLAVNSAMRMLHGMPVELAAVHRNIMLHVFLDPNASSMYPMWSETAARAVAKFRRNYGMNVGNRSFETLIEYLSARSEHFAQLWEAHDVGNLHGTISDEIRHPQLGMFQYLLQAFCVPGTQAQTLVVLLPRSPRDEGLVTALLADDKHGSDASALRAAQWTMSTP